MNLNSVGRGSCRAAVLSAMTRLGRSLALPGLLAVIAPIRAAPAWVTLGEVTGGQLKEISGLVASRRHPGVLWVHNDGKDGRLFAIRTNGTTAAVLRLPMSVTDLEDIAIGPGPAAGVPHLYVGDIGDNDRTRRGIRILRLPEPDLPSGTTAKKPALLTGVDSIPLRYPDGPHDAETLVCDPRTGDLLIVTKQRRKARVYLAAARQLAPEVEVRLELVREIPYGDISGGDLSPDGRHLLLRREEAAWVWTLQPDETVARVLAGSPRPAAVVGPPEEANGEAIGWSPDGQGYYTLSEGKRQPIYYFPFATGPAVGP